MEGLAPLSETEAARFLESLPSQPRLIARTGTDSQFRPMRRALAPIEDSATISRWTSSLRQAIIDRLFRDVPPLSWTAFLPLRIESRPYHWSDEASHSDNCLLICVAPGTTGWQQAARAALDCRAILQGHEIHDMETLVAELELVLGGPGSEPAPPAPVSTNTDESSSQESSRKDNIPVELQDVFDLRFSAPHSGFGASFIPTVNEALLPFLPLPGQNILPVDISNPGQDLLSGSLTCFLRLEDSGGRISDTVYALASRHVAVQKLYDHYTVFMHTSSPIHQDSSSRHSDTVTPDSVPDIEICTGSSTAIDRQQVELRNAKRQLATWIQMFTKMVFRKAPKVDGSDIDYLELAEEFRNRYIDEALEGMAALSLRGQPSTRTRHVGHVAYAADHGIDTEGFWRDWALIALPPAAQPKQAGIFFTNRIFMGGWVERVFSRLFHMQPLGSIIDDYSSCMPDRTDELGILTVQAPHPPMSTRGSTYVRPVVKRGPVTGLTVGLLSPIEAVVRRPLPGVDAVVWAWPVLSCTLKPNSALSSDEFSAPGDSGSLVFDTDGVAVGMVDAGLGIGENSRRTFEQRHTAVDLADGTAPGPRKPTLALVSQNSAYIPPDQDAVPPSFMRWDVSLPEGGRPGRTNQLDITLITPFERVFASIKEVTGKTPRMV